MKGMLKSRAYPTTSFIVSSTMLWRIFRCWIRWAEVSGKYTSESCLNRVLSRLDNQEIVSGSKRVDIGGDIDYRL